MKIDIIIALGITNVILFGAIYVIHFYKAWVYCKHYDLVFWKFWLDVMLLRNHCDEDERWQYKYKKNK